MTAQSDALRGVYEHVFFETARDRNRCHLCLKPREHISHVTEGRAREFRERKPCRCGAGLADGQCPTCWPT